MITCQLVYCAPVNDLPGVVPGFSYALGISDEEAFDILADAGKEDRIVVVTFTDAAFGRLVSNCNVAVAQSEDELALLGDVGHDIVVQVLENQPDDGLIAFYSVEVEPELAPGCISGPGCRHGLSAT